MYYLFIYYTILILGIVIGFYRFKKLAKSTRVFWLLLIVTMISELCAYLCNKLISINYLVYHIFSPLQYCFVALGFNKELKLEVIKISIPLMIITSIIISVWFQPVSKLNTFYINLNFFITTLIAVYYLWKLLKLDTEYSFSVFPLFWISCGFLFFNISNLFAFGTFNTFFKVNNQLERVFAYVRIFTNYLLYLLFVIAFLVKQYTLLDDER